MYQYCSARDNKDVNKLGFNDFCTKIKISHETGGKILPNLMAKTQINTENSGS
jgi:hypothetical protein